MNAKDLPQALLPEASSDARDASVQVRMDHQPLGISSVLPPAGIVEIGELLALTLDGHEPIVRCAARLEGQSVVARSVVDLQGRHVGMAVVLAFEGGDPSRPIVMGVLQGAGRVSDQAAGLSALAQVQVDADGHRLVIASKERLVLRCGKASITLTRAGKVLIEGEYISSRSTGVNRIKGGSIQLN